MKWLAAPWAAGEGRWIPAACVLIAGVAGALSIIVSTLRRPLVASADHEGFEWIAATGRRRIPWREIQQLDRGDLTGRFGAERWFRLVAPVTVTVTSELSGYALLAETVERYAAQYLADSRRMEHTGPFTFGTVTVRVRGIR